MAGPEDLGSRAGDLAQMGWLCPQRWAGLDKDSAARGCGLLLAGIISSSVRLAAAITPAPAL